MTYRLRFDRIIKIRQGEQKSKKRKIEFQVEGTKAQT